MADGAGAARLLVHVGGGKTGSSSIQDTLRGAGPALAAQGAAYLGLMLEGVATPRHPWQVHGGSDAFFRRTDLEAVAAEVHGVLAEELRRLGASGTGLAIWSNEWMFQRAGHVLPALLRLRAEGFRVEVLCYLRRMDGWLRSAYVQWVLKDKRARGPIPPFRDWWRGGNAAMHGAADLWAQALGADFRLRNFDAAGDVVAHFLAECGLDPAMPARRANDTPYPALLAAWVVHNARFREPVRPARFIELWRRSGILDPLKLPPPAALLPDEAEMAAVRARYAEDTDRLNALLAAQGEPPLDVSRPLPPMPGADPWEMQVLLLRMLHATQEEVQALRREVAALRARLPEAGPGDGAAPGGGQAAS